MMIIQAKKDLKLKSGKVIAKGTKGEAKPSQTDTVCLVTFEGNEKPLRIVYAKASEFITGFKKAPNVKALEKQSESGIARSVTGQKVEPDGIDAKGFPSWFRAWGLI